MKRIYNKFQEQLFKLKNDYGAIRLKIEFENEHTTERDNGFLKRLSLDSGLDLAIKICGCAGVRDLIEAEKISPQSIIAPMIESSYALDKYFLAAQSNCDLSQLDLYFNIETIDGLNNLDKILNSQYINKFKGIVFGRSDFCASLGLNQEEVDSEIVFKHLNRLLKSIHSSNLKVIIGGCVTEKSKNFFQQVDSDNFQKIETRKIIFDKNILLKNFDQGISLAIEFEKLWLNAKEYKTPFDVKRVEQINQRIIQKV